MSCNHLLYHLPYHIFFCLESSGFLPKRLIECQNKPPLYFACQIGQSHCWPWQKKGNKRGSICTPAQTDPVDCVLVDQVLPSHPSLILKIYGFISNQKLWGCTTFVDHVSNYICMHLIRGLSLSETLLAKAVIEKILAQAGKTIKHYHANNGRFLGSGFVDAIN